jgi:stage II sporulation protein D
VRRLRLAAAAAAVLALGSAPAHAAEALDDAIRKAAAAVNPAGALYRVGLDVGHRVLLSSDRPFTIVDPATGKAAWRDAYTGETALIADGGPEGEPATVFRIQVAAFGDAAAAEAERADLEKRFGAPAVSRFVPDRGSWRVRIGEARERAGLQTLMAKLRDAGRTGMWVAEEPQAASGPVTLRIVDASWNSAAAPGPRLLALPAAGALVAVNGKPYRGAIEVRVDASGRLRAIDWIELESYLRGVVPSELGPEVWPQIEALKAQAVAARTYAVANRGQFDDDGYDICATPRCQAYGGASAEHPLSDRAVLATAGEIATWQGKPIDALYTATCGGHTEDAALIFPEQAAPYLLGVSCRAEDAGLSRLRATLQGAPPAPPPDGATADGVRDLALLSAAGVFGTVPSRGWPKDLSRPLSAATLRAWTDALARLSGLPAPQGAPLAPSTLPRAALALARDLGWEERARVLAADSDLPAMARDRRIDALPPEERRALAYLASQGALSPGADGRWELDRAPTGAVLALALARIGDAYDAFGLEEATVTGSDGRSVVLLRKKESGPVPLAPAARLFTAAGSKEYPVAELSLWPGDKIRMHRDASGRIDFLELKPPLKGVSDDRFAVVYSWEVRRSGAELQEAIDKRVAVGTLLDLKVKRRGASGRIVELEVVGSKATTLVKGFDVRNILDLRESLTVIELQRDAAGHVVSAVFAGKGWGHGVGLCQVGAYGMAVRGADYKTILSHYYTGIALAPISGLAPGGPVGSR